MPTAGVGRDGRLLLLSRIATVCRAATLVAIAAATVEQPAEPTRPALRRCNPGSRLPGWVVPHMLLMPTFENSHPVTFLIPMEARDSPVHALSDTSGLTCCGTHRCSNI